MQLFRQQAIDHQHRLYGEVLLVRPLPWQAIAWLFLALVALSASLLAFGTYSRTIAASGMMGRDGRIMLSVPASALPQISNGQRVLLVSDDSSPGSVIYGIVEDAGSRPGGAQIIARIDPSTGSQPALRGQPMKARIIVGRQSFFQWLTGKAAAQP